jgi:hypothetical protein
MLSPAAAVSAETTSADCSNCGSCKVQSHSQNLAEIPVNSGTESICLMCPNVKIILLPNVKIDFLFREVDNFDGSKKARIDGNRIFQNTRPLQTIHTFYLRC